MLTLEKLQWLWEKMNNFRMLFSDLTRGDFDNFMALISSADSYWVEVVGADTEEPVGVIYWTGLNDLVAADVHLIFWDSQPMSKIALCKEAARWFFAHFPHRRMQATLPIVAYKTIRLAKRIGFVEEGCKRQSQIMGSKPMDEVILGLLYTEVKE